LFNKLFRKKVASSFGLDIGSSCVKVIQLQESGGRRTLTGLGVVTIPNETITDGSIRDPQTVSDAIKEAVAKAGVKGEDAVISICGRELIIKKIQVPEVPPTEVGSVVELEAEHHIPFAIDEVFLDHHTVGVQNGQMDLILVAVKKQKVTEYMSVVEQAGFAPVIVDVDGFALGNQFELNNPDEGGEAVALIDIGASVMKTNVVRAGATIFARDIPFGGNNYTQAIAQRLNIAFEQAEAAKLGKDVGVKWETLVPALEAVSRDLSLEVQRTFDYFASTAESERIGKIVLAGGCAQLPGLNEYLSSNWGIPVELARPFDGIDVPGAYSDEVQVAGPAFAVAVGLGLRHPGDREVPKKK
jgi:type IV pilus assembly protein PilM